MYLQFKNVTQNDVVMAAIDGTTALITAGSVATLDAKFAALIDPGSIRQLTFETSPNTTTSTQLTELAKNTSTE